MATIFGFLYMVCTLAPPEEYDWTVHVRRWCGLMSNYFDHLLLEASVLLLTVHIAGAGVVAVWFIIDWLVRCWCTRVSWGKLTGFWNDGFIHWALYCVRRWPVAVPPKSGYLRQSYSRLTLLLFGLVLWPLLQLSRFWMISWMLSGRCHVHFAKCLWSQCLLSFSL